MNQSGAKLYINPPSLFVNEQAIFYYAHSLSTKNMVTKDNNKQLNKKSTYLYYSFFSHSPKTQQLNKNHPTQWYIKITTPNHKTNNNAISQFITIDYQSNTNLLCIEKKYINKKQTLITCVIATNNNLLIQTKHTLFYNVKQQMYLNMYNSSRRKMFITTHNLQAT